MADTVIIGEQDLRINQHHIHVRQEFLIDLIDDLIALLLFRQLGRIQRHDGYHGIFQQMALAVLDRRLQVSG